MSNHKPFALKFLIKAFFAVLLSAPALVACSGGSAPENHPNPAARSSQDPPSTITISVSATPLLVPYNGTSDITWSASEESSSCSSSPAGISGIGGTFTTPPLTSTTTYTITCIGPDTIPKNERVTIAVGTTSIINVQAAFAAEPTRGTVYYYCDCGTGAENDCVAGNDSNAGTSASAPRRTIANAISRLNSLTGTNTVALCKGGAFDAQSQLSLGPTGCAAGTTCTDLREYSSATFTGTAKPIVNSAPNSTLFFAEGNVGGVRIMNVSLKGDNNNGTTGDIGAFLYNGAHDIKFYNLDMSNFQMAVVCQEGTSESPNTELVGNNIYHNYQEAFLGGGSGTKVNYNYITDTGSNTILNHAIYMLGGYITSYNVEVIGNDIHGQYGSTCLGSSISNHGAWDGFTISNNTITLAENETTAGCYGLASDNVTNDPRPVFHRNAVFSDNVIINGGNTSLTISSCPGCIIENNVIINNWGGAVIGISITGTNRGQDDTSTANVIRNNTVWYGPNVTGDTRGIQAGVNGGEGTNHVISNNTVSSEQSSGTLNCYRHDLPLSSYAFVNNNHCYATRNYRFEYTRGTLAAWQTYSSFDTNSISSAPLFVNAGTDFKPDTGSPLRGAGDNTNKSILDFTGVTRPNPPAIGAFEP